MYLHGAHRVVRFFRQIAGSLTDFRRHDATLQGASKKSSWWGRQIHLAWNATESDGEWSRELEM
jgi:hypothetical protein